MTQFLSQSISHCLIVFSATLRIWLLMFSSKYMKVYKKFFEIIYGNFKAFIHQNISTYLFTKIVTHSREDIARTQLTKLSLFALFLIIILSCRIFLHQLCNCSMYVYKSDSINYYLLLSQMFTVIAQCKREILPC